MKYKFGFIGCGNMGSALAKGVSKTVLPSHIAVCDTSDEKALMLQEQIKCVKVDIADLVSESEYIFIAVKPQGYVDLFSSISPLLSARSTPPVIISMAAGTSIEKLTGIIGRAYPIIRIMPNTPVAVGRGVTLYSHNSLVSEENIDEFCRAMKETGAVMPIDEAAFDSESIVTGCGPAYVFMFIEALAAAARELGISDEAAELYAKNTVYGAAALAIESEQTPAVLRERVCSPGGSTIEGIKLMRERAFEKTVVDAARASYDRTLEMKKL